MKEFLLFLSLLQGISTSAQEVTNPPNSDDRIEISTQNEKKNPITATITYNCEDLVKKNLQTIIHTLLTILMKEKQISSYTIGNSNPKINSFSFTVSNTNDLQFIYTFFTNFLPRDGISLSVDDLSITVAPHSYAKASMDKNNVFLPPFFIQMLDKQNIPWSPYPADEYTPDNQRFCIVVKRENFDTFLKQLADDGTDNRTLVSAIINLYTQTGVPLIPVNATQKNKDNNQEETITKQTLAFTYTIGNDKLARNFYIFLDDYIKHLTLKEYPSVNTFALGRYPNQITVFVGLEDASQVGDLFFFLHDLSPNNTGDLAYFKKADQVIPFVLPPAQSSEVKIPAAFNRKDSSETKTFKNQREYRKWLKSEFTRYLPEYRNALEKELKQQEKRSDLEKNFKNLKNTQKIKQI